MLAEAITPESTVNIGLVLAVLVPSLGSAALAIAAAVTTRNGLAALKSKVEEDRKADLARIDKLETRMDQVVPQLAVVHDRQGRSGSYNKITVSEE